MLRVVVTAACVPEREGGKQVLQKVHQMGQTVCRLYLIWADRGYDCNPFLQWDMNTFRWVIQVVLRPKEAKGFVLIKSDGWWNELSVGGIGTDA